MVDLMSNRNNGIYKCILDLVEDKIGSGITTDRQLDVIGRDMFGDSFLGVFSADSKVTVHGKSPKFAIVNLDDSDEPGSHWIGVIYLNNKKIVYDSFGRDLTNIPEVHEVQENEIQENRQGLLEMNCGARVIAWFILFEYWGLEAALQI